MEQRKLIAFGKNSLVISLPRDWAKENSLKKGDSVFVEENRFELRITPSEKKERQKEKAILIECQNKNIGIIITEIVSAYLNNYDEIEIINPKEKDIIEIKNRLRNLAGMEIMEITSKKIKARALLDERQVSLKNIIRRLDYTIRSMIDDSISSINEGKYQQIFERDIDVNRMVFLSYRVMRRALAENNFARTINITPIEVLTDWLIIMRLEKIGDQTKRIARNVSGTRENKKWDSELKDIYSKIKKYYIEVMESYYKNDRERAMIISVELKDMIPPCYKFLERHHDPKLIIAVENLKNMISSITHIARSIIGAG